MMLFHGKIDINKLNFGEKLMIRAIGAPTGDVRDWDAITAWAEGVATVLLQLETTVGSGS
jgi:menaquinone-dependent protoporphyrinogen oxidase